MALAIARAKGASAAAGRSTRPARAVATAALLPKSALAGAAAALIATSLVAMPAMADWGIPEGVSSPTLAASDYNDLTAIVAARGGLASPKEAKEAEGKSDIRLKAEAEAAGRPAVKVAEAPSKRSMLPSAPSLADAPAPAPAKKEAAAPAAKKAAPAPAKAAEVDMSSLFAAPAPAAKKEAPAPAAKKEAPAADGKEEGNGGIAAGGAIMVGLIIAALASQNNGQSAGKEGGDHAHGHSEKKE